MNGDLPRLAVWLVRNSVRPALAEDVLGDLEEVWRNEASGRFAAWRRVIQLAFVVWWHGRMDRLSDRRSEPHQRIMAGVLQDMRIAMRLCIRQPRLSLAVILTLAIGVGASTSMLTAARSVVTADLPFPDSSRLVHVWATWPGGSGNFSYPDFEAVRHEVTALDDAAAYESWGSIALGVGGRPVRLTPTFVSARYLPMLGATAVAGRLLDDADQAPGAPAVAVISAALWQRQFGGDAQAVGRLVTLNGAPYLIVGVMRPGFADLGEREEPPSDIWLPVAAAQPLLGQPSLTEVSRIFWGLGRLAPGATLVELRAQLDAVAARMADTRPATHRDYHLQARPLHEYLQGAIAAPARLLIVASLLMLLIGCANVANLMMARAAERRGEFAVRVAIGASGGRLLRQALVETAVLAGAGGLLGLALALVLTRALSAWVAAHVSSFVVVRGDAAAFAISATLTILTSVLVGVAPALAAARSSRVGHVANTTGRGGGTRLRRRVRAVFVTAEVALSVVLIVGAGLLTRSTFELTSSGLGFRTERLVTFRLDLSGEKYRDGDSRSRFAQSFVDAAGAIPGVESATIWGPSMLGNATWVMNLLPEGRPTDRPGGFTMAFFHSTSVDGLRHLGIPIVAGREFTSLDTAASTPVVIISEALAREFWPGGEGIDLRLQRSNPQLPLLTVVGIAQDARHRQRYSLGDIADGLSPLGLAAQRDVYLPYAQRPNNAMTVAVRAVDPGRAAGALRDAVASLDAGLAVDDMRTLDDRLAAQNQGPEAIATLMTVYAVMAVLLAGVGLYSVITHAVLERTREIGIRIALGARTGTVLGLVFREAAWLVVTGLAVGLGVSAALARLTRMLLYGVAPTDPVTFVTAAATLAVLALAAMWHPLRRAARVDPTVALRGG